MLSLNVTIAITKLRFIRLVWKNLGAEEPPMLLCADIVQFQRTSFYVCFIPDPCPELVMLARIFGPKLDSGPNSFHSFPAH